MAPNDLVVVKELVDETWFNALTCLIESQVLGSSSASISFSPIPDHFTNLTVIAFSAQTGSGNANHKLTLNADTGATQYHDMKVYARGSGHLTATTTAGAFIDIGSVSGTGAPTSTMHPTIIDIFGYNQARETNVFGYSALQSGTATQGTYIFMNSGYYRATNAVTSIELTPSTGSYATGSMFSLYGWG